MKSIIGSLALFTVLVWTSQEWIYQHVEMPYLQDNRRSPVELHEDIKTFAVDDTAANAIGGVAIGNTSWLSVIASLIQRKPQAIVIDHTFDFKEQLKDNALGKDMERLAKANGTRIIVQTLQSPKPLSDKETYRSASIKTLQRHPTHGAPHLPLLDQDIQTYGPHSYIQEAFTGFGHNLVYRNNHVTPVFRLGTDEFLPAMALLAASSYYFLKDQLHINDKPILVDSRREIPLLWPKLKDFEGRIRPLSDLLGPGIQSVTSKDYVLLIPQYYSGGYKTVPSWIGDIHPIFYQWTLLNSVLTQRWLTPVDYPWIWGLALLGIVLGLRLLILKSWTKPQNLGINALISISTSLFYVALAASTNLYWDVYLPILLPSFSILILLGLDSAQYFSSYQQRKLQIQSALAGLAPQAEIARLIQHHNYLHTPHEKIVTLVVIEIAGYAQISDSLPPQLAFARLKKLHQFLITKVQAASGFIAEYSADQVLCIFGMDATQENLSSHADAAIDFARTLQTEHIGYIEEAHKMAEAFYPLRIGIHTARVAFGDLGEGGRIHYTVLGGALEIGRHVMSSCELHSIAMSRSSIEMSSVLDNKKSELSSKTVSIKNKASSVEIIEWDLLREKPETRTQLYEAFLTHAKMARIEKRYFLENPSCVSLGFVTSPTKVILVNYSSKGFCIKTPQSIRIGEHEEITFQDLGNTPLFDVTFQVKWICPESDGYLYGCYVRDEAQMQIAFSTLQKLDREKVKNLSQAG